MSSAFFSFKYRAGETNAEPAPLTDCSNLCQTASSDRELNRASPIKVNDLLFLRLSPNRDTWVLYDSAVSKWSYRLWRGISTDDLWGTELRSVMYGRKKKEPTLLKVLFTKSATQLLELNTRDLGRFIFQLRKGATCTANQRKPGMWCIWKGWYTTGPAAPTKTLTASACGGTAW